MRRKSILLILMFCLIVASPNTILLTNAQDDDDTSEGTSSAVIIGPQSYPEGINPLTGLPVDDPAVLEQRPIMVKIINAPAEVRPQHGLMEADIVWEHLLAGGITRFSAIYLSQAPEYIGPIRSARLVDFELMRIYRSLLSYSGMSEGTIQIMRNDSYVPRFLVGGEGPCPALCRFPEASNTFEYTLFANVPALRDYAEELGRDTAFEPINSMAFSETIPNGGVALNGLNVAYRNTHIDWTYDNETGFWLRSQDGEPHLDSNTNSRVTAANVLILEEDHTEQPFVRDGFWGPGNFAFSVNFIGSGRIILLRDGQYFEGEWRRETQDGTLTYFDLEGKVLPFKPGNTFVNLMPRWADAYQLTFDLEETGIAISTFNGANMRGGPGAGYPAVGVASLNEELTVIGRNADATWLQVLKDDRVMWISTEVATPQGDLMFLPLVRPTIE